MIPELPVAMLACTRIGVAHSVIFGGFSPDAIVDRCEDAEAPRHHHGGCRVPPRGAVGTEGQRRRTRSRPAHPRWRRSSSSTVVTPTSPWWRDVTSGGTKRWPTRSADCPPLPVDSEHLLYLLYTSGTTAKPKGIMHTTGGYLTQVAFTHRYVFDLKPDEDIYWCSADIGWVTGHSYIVYGPLANGATSVIYEGTPDTPRLGSSFRLPRLLAEGSPVGHRRAVRGDPAVHRPHRHPHLHEVGGGRTGPARPVEPASSRDRR